MTLMLKDWRQEEKGMTEDEMFGWHHWLDGREFEWTPGIGDGQEGLAFCDSWGRKELDRTERLNWTELTEPSLGWPLSICKDYSSWENQLHGIWILRTLNSQWWFMEPPVFKKKPFANFRSNLRLVQKATYWTTRCLPPHHQQASPPTPTRGHVVNTSIHIFSDSFQCT